MKGAGRMNNHIVNTMRKLTAHYKGVDSADRAMLKIICAELFGECVDKRGPWFPRVLGMGSYGCLRYEVCEVDITDRVVNVNKNQNIYLEKCPAVHLYHGWLYAYSGSNYVWEDNCKIGEMYMYDGTLILESVFVGRSVREVVRMGLFRSHLRGLFEHGLLYIEREHEYCVDLADPMGLDRIKDEVMRAGNRTLLCDVCRVLIPVIVWGLLAIFMLGIVFTLVIAV